MTSLNQYDKTTKDAATSMLLAAAADVVLFGGIPFTTSGILVDQIYKWHLQDKNLTKEERIKKNQ